MDGLMKCFRKTTHPRKGGHQGWEEAKVADTLNVFDNSESRTPIVICFEPGIARREGGASRFVMDKSTTLRAEMGDNKPAVCYALEGNGSRPSHLGPGFNDDGTMYMLNTIEKHSICYAVENHPNDSRVKLKDDGISETLTSRCGTGGGNVPLVLQPSERKYIIRRLTPTECGRLQGFPDWWVDGAEGSDSAVYKMWGNGIALPCAADVLGRIAKELKGDE